MKRILFITPFPPDKKGGGGEAYTAHLLEELAKGNQIDLVYFRYKGGRFYEPESGNIRVVSRRNVSVSRKVLSVLSLPWLFPQFTARFRWSVVRMLRRLISTSRYDFVYLDFSQTFAYALFIKHPNVILMSHDVLCQRYERIGSGWMPWVKWSEKRVMAEGKAIVTFSQKDSDIVRTQYGLDSWPTNFFLEQDAIDARPTEEGSYFVFYGDWRRFENKEAIEWFLDNVYPMLDTDSTAFKVIGRGMPENIYSRLAALPNFEHLGFIENPYPIIANAVAEIAPLHYGAGVKTKCVHALCCGTPVIGTDVAFEGIPDLYSKSMVSAVSPKDYVNAILTEKRTLKERQEAKDYFINTYRQKGIMEYINGQMNNE